MQDLKKNVFENDLIKSLIDQLSEEERIQTIKTMEQIVDQLNGRFDMLSKAITKAAENAQKK